MSAPTAKDLQRAAPGIFKVNDLNKGETLVFSIKDVKIEELGQTKEPKQVVSFVETPRRVVLNQTRLAQLSDICGDDPLIGQKIGVTRDTLTVRGRDIEMVVFVDPDGVKAENDEADEA